MRLTVLAKPRARQNSVVPDPSDPAKCTVCTTQPAEKGRANDAILKLVAEHFKVAPSRVTLISGATSRVKVVEVQME